LKNEKESLDQVDADSPANGPESSPPPKQKKTLLDTLTAGGDPEPAPPPPKRKPRSPRAGKIARGGFWLPAVGWIVAFGAVALAAVLWISPPAALAGRLPDTQATRTPRPTLTPAASEAPAAVVALPSIPGPPEPDAIPRLANPLTIIPSRPRTETVLYVVEQGDAIFSIADFFNIEPETVLWANYDLLNDNPDFLEIGMELNIPPVDGVYYQWQEGDTFERVADEFEAEIEDILNFSGNRFDLANPVVEPGEWVMLPDGHREFRQWLIPTINRGNAGVNSAALGPGACSGSYTGPVGSGAFIWPSSNHTLSGNDYWSGHLAIDIGAVGGDPVFSSDAGVVVFTGWANGGYGYTVVVDHGNGYQTLYAHLSGVSRPCGAGVGAGTVIGTAGSTGNSTGTHLHFEVRLNGGFINPWFVLPPP
jgi:murein DD-endopeptidase MepM/ murein hydrolase activator NlpD